MQAALILILCGWAGSIGFRINESCVAIIKQQSETINELQAVRGSSVNNNLAAAKPAKEISHEKRANQDVAASPEASREVRTPAGRLVTVRSDADSASRSADTDRDRSVSRISGSFRWGAGGRGYSNRQPGRGVDNSSGEAGDFRRLPISEPSLSDIR